MAGKQPFRANSAYQNQDPTDVAGLVMEIDRWRLKINEAEEEEEEPFDDEDLGLAVADEDQEVLTLGRLYADVDKESGHKLTSVRETEDARSEQPMSVQSKATDDREVPVCKAFESDTSSVQHTPKPKDLLMSALKESYLPTA